MSELLKIYFLSSNVRTCFFYRNNIDFYKDHSDDVWGIKIKFGKKFEFTTFGSISLLSVPEVPDKCIGVSSLLASKLGLQENDQVLISNFFSPSIQALEMSPKREEDYVILLSCKSIIEAHLLNQVRVVAKGQTLPLHVFSNIVIDVEIGKCKPDVESGQLEKFTEVTILQPSQKLSVTNKKFNSQNEIDEKTRSCRDVYSFINNFNKLLAKPIKSTRKNQEQSNKEYSELFKLEDKKKNKFIIWPKLLLPDDLPVDILDKFIVVTCIDKIENSFGPYSVKMLCRVQSIEQNLTNELVNSYNQDDESSGSMMSKQDNNDRKDPTDRKKLTWFNSYIICNDNYGNSDKNKNNKKQIVFCSSQIMAKLKVFVGAKLKIEKPQLGLQSSFDSFPTVKPKITEEVKYIFWETMEDIKKNTIKNTINSIKFNCTINTLIVGSIGTGKTTLLNALIEIFSHNFIFNRIIYCKTLRKKKIEAISKVLLEILRSCCRHEPAILILDDLHAMTYVDEEQNQCNKLYSDRIVEMMTELLKAFQEKYNVIVLATTVGLEELGSMVTSRGPRFFQNVEKITEMSTTDRHLMLNEIIKFKSKDLAVGSLDLKKMAEKTNGYAIQDLNDVVDKAVLKCFTRGENLRLSQSDFDEALSESIPLLLRGTDLKERNVGKTWKDVGGMQEPKRVLIEVFLWPSKYPKLLESCPLRLQRGVLLYGAPGTGKTLLAGALANKCNLNFISVKGPEILSKYVGASEEGVRNLFIQAHKTQPCLLFFDEFDSLASKRGHDSTGVTDRVVNQLLTQLDGVEAISGVWVLAATSRPDLLDPALLRPGRLDKMVFCDLPNKADRISILKALSQDMPNNENIDFEQIANKSDGYTGADLQAILYAAQILAIKEMTCDLQSGATAKVEQKHLLAAFADTKPSLTPTEKLKYSKIYEKFLNSRKKNVAKRYIGMSQKITLA